MLDAAMWSVMKNQSMVDGQPITDGQSIIDGSDRLPKVLFTWSRQMPHAKRNLFLQQLLMLLRHLLIMRCSTRQQALFLISSTQHESQFKITTTNY